MTALDRVRNGSSLALCLAGLGLLAYWCSAVIDAHVVQRRLAHRLETTVPSGFDSPIVRGAPATRREANTSGLVGRLEIPRLGISAMITEGVTERALGRGIGHVPDTAFPGEWGNVGLAAHRDTYFRRLKDVDTGDHVRLRTPDGVISYEVEWARIVDPGRIDLLEDTAGPALTLVTCYPFNWVGSAPKRFVVRCRPIDEPAVLRAGARSTMVAATHPGGAEMAVPISAPVELTLEIAADSLDLVLEAPGRLPQD